MARRFLQRSVPFALSMTKIEAQFTTSKQASPSNRSFLHYPVVPTFLRLFHQVGKSGRCPATRWGVPGAFDAPQVQIEGRMGLNFTDL